MRRLTLAILAALCVSTNGTAQTRPSFVPAEIASAGITVAVWNSTLEYGRRREQELRGLRARSGRAEQRAQIAESTLSALAQRLLISNPSASATQIVASFDSVLRSYDELVEDLDRMRERPDLEVLWPQFRRIEDSLAAGDIAMARQLVDEAVALSENMAKPAASIMRTSANLYVVEGKLEDAANAMDRAADFTDPVLAVERLELRTSATVFRLNARRTTSSVEYLRAQVASLRVAERQLLQMNREDPAWAGFWNGVYYGLGTALDELAERGDVSAINEAVAAWQNAKRSPNLTPNDIAKIDIGIGSVLSLAAVHGGPVGSDARSGAMQAYLSARATLRAGGDIASLTDAEGGILSLRVISPSGSNPVQYFRDIASEARAVVGSLPVDTTYDNQRKFLSEILVQAIIHQSDYGDRSSLNEALRIREAELERLDRTRQPREYVAMMVQTASLSAYANPTDIARMAESRLQILEAISITDQNESATNWAIFHWELGKVAMAIGNLSGRRTDYEEAVQAFSQAREGYRRIGRAPAAEAQSAYIEQAERARRRAR